MKKTKPVGGLFVVLVLVAAFAAWVFAGNLDPTAGPDDPGSAMYTLDDIYNYLDTGVAGTKRTGAFTEPASSPGSTGYTLDEVHAKIGERCITCAGTLNGTRWCDQGDGTVKDMTTGLVWLQNAAWGGQKMWRNSSTDCSGPNYTCYDDAHSRADTLAAGAAGAGLSDGSVEGDWRLPTKAELSGLANGTEAIRSGSPGPFTGVQSSRYWSSTTVATSPSFAWYVTLSNGSRSVGYKGDLYYVWPVRAGQ